MPHWLKKLFGVKPPEPRRPSEIPVDERALELVNLGDKMFAVEDLKGALDAYESALRLDGHCAAAWQRRGRIFLRDGNHMAAMACYARSLELDAQQAAAWSGIGEGILAFIRDDKEPIFIRENRSEIVSEACDCFSRALKLDAALQAPRHGLETCREMMRDKPFKLASPRLFSFHSGGILEKAKRDFVSPFLKPGDYRRQTPPSPPND